MPTTLEWTQRATFRDGSRGDEYVGPGVFDVPDDAVEEYLDHRSGGWQRPEAGDDDEQEQANNEEEQDDEQPAADDEPLETLDGVGSAIADSLRDEGYETTADIRETGAETLAAVENVTDSLAESLAGRDADDGDEDEEAADE